jgi:predicted site-specific integrase-resolvase
MEHRGDPDLLGPTAAARLAGVSSDAVRVWDRSGKLPATRTANGMRLFARRDVEAWLIKRELAPRRPAAPAVVAPTSSRRTATRRATRGRKR